MPDGLRDLTFRTIYDSGDNPLENFYVPALARAITYDRAVGYFRSSSLSVAARGLSGFIRGGGRMRLLCGTDLTAADRDALCGTGTLDGAFAQRLANQLFTDSEVASRRLEVLAWLAKQGRLDVRVAVAIDPQGVPLVGGLHDPYFHVKVGVLTDAAGDGVVFHGSVNETETAWKYNFEDFSVFTSWDETKRFNEWSDKFARYWRGDTPGFRIYSLPQAAYERLLSLAPEVEPPEHDPEHLPPRASDATVARFLSLAPRLLGGQDVAASTVGVKLLPHQRQVGERLAGMYPRSWLVADEVGLGKTISAGMALRRLLLSGQVSKVLILAPANVCVQWQDELFEKFGLWVPRLDKNKIWGVSSRDERRVQPDTNPYADYPVLIASSHLARRTEQQRKILDAAPYDLIILDEAHHARRQEQNPNRYRPGRLLSLLDQIEKNQATNALWLLSATPMQVSAVELRDLLVHIGLGGSLADPENFERYFREIAREDQLPVTWRWLADVTRDSIALPLTGAEDYVTEKIARDIGPIRAKLIAEFTTPGGRPGDFLAQQLGPSGRVALREWLVAMSPVSRLVTRHGRDTLRTYIQKGLIDQTLAERRVESRIAELSPEARELYEALDALIDRLGAAHGTTKGLGFVLTIYRRRLTSSWAAIRATLLKRLAKEPILDEDDLQVVQNVSDENDSSDDAVLVPLTKAESVEIQKLVDRMLVIDDPKFDALRHDIDEARSEGRSMIVFTQYTDTLDALREKIESTYRTQMATYTGDGGRIYGENGWEPITKQALVDAINSGRVTVLLATDAASEGLNLQACSYLVNFDMPWNPMRVEQRIGRIDRLGQAKVEIHVRNYFIADTVEQSVYSALADRINVFNGMVGGLQPILGSTEHAFQDIFKTPRGERDAALARHVRNLMREIDVLKDSGIALGEPDGDDHLPIPPDAPVRVSLEDLRQTVIERFSGLVDDLPLTWEPEKVSREEGMWRALATYGHHALEEELARWAGDGEINPALVIAEEDGVAVAMRADITPPRAVTTVSEIDELGWAVSRDEAEAIAQRELAAEIAKRREAAALVGKPVRSVAAHATLAERFLALARRVLKAGCRATGCEPEDVWDNHLRAETFSDWVYAEDIRDRLGVSREQIFEGVTSRGHMSDVKWIALREETKFELRAIADEYKNNGA